MAHGLQASERPRSAALAPEALVAAACERVGADADQAAGELRFLDGLERLVEAVTTEARLSERGERSTRAALVAALATQLRARRALAERPEIDALPIERPIVVAGLPRTGSTLLQNLFACHPGLRVPHLWELMHPVDEGTGTEALVAATARYVEDYYRAAPAFRAIHHLDAELPEECHRLTGTAFANDIYAWRYDVPGYAEWLDGRDLRDVYGWHATLLRLILWREPGERVALKCPTHVWHLADLSAVYPDACVVRLHRDPAKAIASACSLTAAIRSARSDHVDHAAIGRYWLERAERVLGSGAAPALPATVQVLDVRYDELVSDPVGTAGTVCDWAGVPLTSEAERAMRAFLDHDPSRRHGAHRYELEDFGLRRADVERRFGDDTKEQVQ